MATIAFLNQSTARVGTGKADLLVMYVWSGLDPHASPLHFWFQGETPLGFLIVPLHDVPAERVTCFLLCQVNNGRALPKQHCFCSIKETK